MPRQPIVVTGIGIVSAVGWGGEAVWSAIEREESGLGRLTLFESPRREISSLCQVHLLPT